MTFLHLVVEAVLASFLYNGKKGTQLAHPSYKSLCLSIDQLFFKEFTLYEVNQENCRSIEWKLSSLTSCTGLLKICLQ